MTPAGRLSPGAATGLVIAGLHFVLGLLLYDPTLFPGGDNAGYMILGDALVSGEGYRDLYLPARPLHAKYPPFYPLLLAALTPFGGLQLFKLASLALTTLAVWATYRLVEELLEWRAAAVAAGLFALSPVLLEYSHYVLSEALFVLLVVGSLSYLQRGAKGGTAEADRLVLALALLGAVGAFLTRTAGLPLLAAIVLYFAIERDWRRAGLATAAAVAAAGGWGVYQRLALGGRGEDAGPTYIREMLLRNPYDPAAGAVGPADLLVRATANAWTYVSEVLPRALTGTHGAGPEVSMLPALLGIGIAALAFLGWAQRSMSRLGPAELFAVLYGLMLILWPPVWTDQRFLLPLAPVILAYVVNGSRLVARRLIRDDRRAAAAALAAAAAAIGLPAAASSIAAIPERTRCLADYRAGSPCDPPAYASFYAAADWARTRTWPDAIISSRKPRIFFWISERRGDLYPYSADPDEVMAGLESLDADYVVVDAISGTTVRYLLPALRDNLQRFETVYEGGDPPTLILRLDPEPATAD